MSRDLIGALRLLVAPTVALVGVVLFAPGRVGLGVRIYALVLSAVALGLALSALRRAYPPARPLRSPTRRADGGRRPPPTLARLEHETALGVASAFDFHHRLRPRLHQLALGLLATRRRVLADAHPASARRILGDETWHLVRRDAPPPEDRLGRGLPIAELRRVVESLERI